MRQLVELEEHGSLGAVARQLGLSQPTISANMSRLEQAIGFPLLTRGPRGARLTVDGEKVAAAARRALEAVNTFALEIEQMSFEETEPLRLAASLTIAEHLVPRWLADRAGAPGYHVAVSVGNSEEVMEWVVRGTVHLGFVEGNSLREGLAHARIGRDELVVVVGRSHPWASLERPLEPEELVTSGLVVREQGSGTLEVLNDALARAGVATPRALPSYGSTAAILTAVRHGGAVAVVSRLAVETDLLERKVVAVAIPGLTLNRSLTAVWDPESPQRRDAAELISALTRRKTRVAPA